jgi:RNA polymerase sigma-70 factor (ECF subfamily)
MNEDERELLAAVASGDQRAFSALFNRYRQLVYNIGWTYIEDKGLAEDILQDVFISLWKHRARLQGIDNFRGYVYTIAKNRAVRMLEQLEHLQRHATFTASFQAQYQLDHTKELSESSLMLLVQEALEHLSPQQRRAFELSRMQGLSREEAAAQMAISKATFSVHLTIALKRIRAFLTYQLDFWLVFLLAATFFSTIFCSPLIT